MHCTLIVDRSRKDTFSTISEALGAARGYWGLPVEIRIARGVYRERFTVTQPHIRLVGESAPDTLVVWGDGAYDILPDGIKRGTFRTAAVMIEGDDFSAENISFQNDAGPGEEAGQALALYIDSPCSRFEKCRLLGHQDTLFLAPLPPSENEPGGFRGPGEHRPRLLGEHSFKSCYIEGDVDFIFGGARALFEECEIFSLNRAHEINGYVTAPCTPQGEDRGFVFIRCRLTSDCPKGTVYLGRPWREFGRAAFIDCFLGEHIHPEGFHDWGKSGGGFEFILSGNHGPGADDTDRADFVKVLDKEGLERQFRGPAGGGDRAGNKGP